MLGEVARPGITDLRSPYRESVSDWLKPADLARIMRDAINGDAESYLTLAEEMEEREPHYRSVLGTRKLAVSGLEINVEAPTDSAHDKAIADDVEKLLRRPDAEGLVTDLMDGVSKGFANVEILWERDLKRWEPRCYEWRSPRHFVWDKQTISECRLRTMREPMNGEELAPYKWLQHRPKLASGVPLRTGLAMPAAVAYMAKRYTVADWLTFLDVYGMPIRVGKFPASMAKQKKDLLRAVQSLGTDAAAVIPEEMTIELLESSGRSGGPLFCESAEYWDKQISKIVLGQTMSSDDGASLAQSKTHERVRFDIRAADGRHVMATITRDLIVPFVILNYGPQDQYPRALVDTKEPEDVTALLANVKIFVDLGGKVQMSEVRDRMGLSEPEEGAELLQPSAKIVADAAPEPDPATNVPKPDTGAARGKVSARTQLARVLDALSAFGPRPAQVVSDVLDELTDEDLADWQPLLDGTVGELLARIQAAESFSEAADIVERLANDKGVVLDLSSFTAALSRSTFRARGIGDATDEVSL